MTDWTPELLQRCSINVSAAMGAADLCSTLGRERADDLCPILGVLAPCAGVGAGGGRSLPPLGSGGITIWKIWIFYI